MDELRDRQLADPEVKARIEDFRKRVACGDAGRGMTAKDLRRYWEEIDKDPEVRRRREAFRKAVQDERVPEGAVYPSEYRKELLSDEEALAAEELADFLHEHG